jgi:hypothetical protein
MSRLHCSCNDWDAPQGNSEAPERKKIFGRHTDLCRRSSVTLRPLGAGYWMGAAQRWRLADDLRLNG